MVLTIFKVGWEKFCSAVENTRNPLSELYSCFIYVTKSKNCFDSQIQFGDAVSENLTGSFLQSLNKDCLAEVVQQMWPLRGSGRKAWLL